MVRFFFVVLLCSVYFCFYEKRFSFWGVVGVLVNFRRWQSCVGFGLVYRIRDKYRIKRLFRRVGNQSYWLWRVSRDSIFVVFGDVFFGGVQRLRFRVVVYGLVNFQKSRSDVGFQSQFFVVIIVFLGWFGFVFGDLKGSFRFFE